MSKVIVSSSYGGKSAETYHTEECVSVQMMRGKNHIEEAEAKERGLSMCSHCAGRAYTNQDSPDFSFYQAAKRAGEAND